MSDENKKYVVGKGKPPKKHQFKPGQSGNPKGRPKGSKNVHHLLSKVLGEKITITDGGKKMVVVKLEGALRVLVNKSFEGSPASLKLILEILRYIDESEQSLVENPFTDEDHAALMKELDWLDEARAARAGETSDDAN